MNFRRVLTRLPLVGSFALLAACAAPADPSEDEVDDPLVSVDEGEIAPEAIRTSTSSGTSSGTTCTSYSCPSADAQTKLADCLKAGGEKAACATLAGCTMSPCKTTTSLFAW